MTPCAGRCSTVFGDHVCRGCRRFNHEVIDWNNYSLEQQAVIWQRLDREIDQILLPLLPHYHLSNVEQFLHAKRVRLMPNASVGRKLYHALKFCEKSPAFTAESGLGIDASQVKKLWKDFEQKILTLAEAHYELAWIRANLIGQADKMQDDE
ncbi:MULTISPECIES: DUF1289 domain-containing protein [unclassified Acinetobacter]|uniref:DUF1289 domain-containing protein n=1 Tax=unclassified Acinetobacter TaxID=196816 RepID=UPI0035B8BBEA